MRSTPEPPVVKQLASTLLAREVTAPGIDTKLAYRLHVPPSYDDAKAYPLILYLHGSGVEGTDNRRHLGEEVRQLIARANAREKTFVLVPQCPRDKWILGENRPVHTNYDQRERAESDGLKLALAALDAVQADYPIDARRLYLVGFSAGSAGTWELLTRHPERKFAAAVPMTGVNDPRQASRIAHLPIWAFHGTEDRVSPVTNTREMVAALRALQSPIRYTEYEGVGHGISLKPFADDEVLRWLLAQRAGSRRD